MLKREDVLPGTVIVVNRQPPTPPGTNWENSPQFVKGLKLEITSKPYKNGGMNLVNVIQNCVGGGTGAVMYSFVTCFCSRSNEKTS